MFLRTRLDFTFSLHTDSHQQQLNHEICLATLSEKAAEDLLHAEDTTQWFANSEIRHGMCFGLKKHELSVQVFSELVVKSITKLVTSHMLQTGLVSVNQGL